MGRKRAHGRRRSWRGGPLQRTRAPPRDDRSARARCRRASAPCRCRAAWRAARQRRSGCSPYGRGQAAPQHQRPQGLRARPLPRRQRQPRHAAAGRPHPQAQQQIAWVGRESSAARRSLSSKLARTTRTASRARGGRPRSACRTRRRRSPMWRPPAPPETRLPVPPLRLPGTARPRPQLPSAGRSTHPGTRAAGPRGPGAPRAAACATVASTSPAQTPPHLRLRHPARLRPCARPQARRCWVKGLAARPARAAGAALPTSSPLERRNRARACSGASCCHGGRQRSRAGRAARRSNPRLPGRTPARRAAARRARELQQGPRSVARWMTACAAVRGVTARRTVVCSALPWARRPLWARGRPRNGRRRLMRRAKHAHGRARQRGPQHGLTAPLRPLARLRTGGCRAQTQRPPPCV